MTKTLSLLALFGGLYLGFSLLALSQDRNWRLTGDLPVPSRLSKSILRISGYAFLALPLPLALWRDGPGFGALMWGTMISVAACAVTTTLSWWPRLLSRPVHLVVSRIKKRTND